MHPPCSPATRSTPSEHFPKPAVHSFPSGLFAEQKPLPPPQPSFSGSTCFGFPLLLSGKGFPTGDLNHWGCLCAETHSCESLGVNTGRGAELRKTIKRRVIVLAAEQIPSEKEVQTIAENALQRYPCNTCQTDTSLKEAPARLTHLNRHLEFVEWQTKRS